MPTPERSQATALTVPEDVRRDLLQAQAAQITSNVRLPQIAILPAGANLFEFSDSQDTVRSFRGVILNTHPRNVLWDRPYGSEMPANEEDSGPACVSNDGVFGAPRPGFAHLGLPGNMDRHRAGQALLVATGGERISCESCPYNQWRTRRLVDPEARNPKGKATTNQKSVYLAIEGRGVPLEMVLPPTSIPPFDKYLQDLTGMGVLAQQVVTNFSLNLVERGTVRYSVLKVERGEPLSQDEFDAILAMRSQYRAAISPPELPTVQEQPEYLDPDEENDQPF